MSTMTSYSHFIRWSDSFERGVAEKNLENGEAISLYDVAVKAAKLVQNAAQKTGRFIAKAARAYCEARVRTAYYYASI